MQDYSPKMQDKIWLLRILIFSASENKHKLNGGAISLLLDGPFTAEIIQKREKIVKTRKSASLAKQKI